MNLRFKVENILSDVFDENPSLFLIELKIGPDNSIHIILDGDREVSLLDCMNISRSVESNLDREEEDFSLEVSSAGVGIPLKNQRQYIKNIGRKLKVEIANETIVEGILTSVNEKNFTLNWKKREAKTIGKGKVTVEKQQTLLYENVVNSKVII
tara:strand:- start:15968 stop:16429 length:462 start_codon:yes stop_codon:yes gene_type:complete